MAVGDTVTEKLDGATNFQPASGVEVKVTAWASSGAGETCNIYDGTTAMPLRNAVTDAVRGTAWFLDNGVYARNSAAGGTFIYLLGIQTK